MLAGTILRVLLVGGLWPVPSLGHLPPAVSPRLAPREGCAEQLDQQLSSKAQVYCSGSDEFANSTQRWSTLDAPTFQMTVEVATESDVVAVVRYANARNISFLPVNNAHGAIVTTGKVHNGIMIWMRQLNSVDIADDGQTATFGGGILDKEVTDGLWAAGKQTGNTSQTPRVYKMTDGYSYRWMRMCKRHRPWAWRRPRSPPSTTRIGLRPVCFVEHGHGRRHSPKGG